VILRLYEPHGARGTAVLRFAGEVRHVERLNLLEEPDRDAQGTLRVDGSTVELWLRPFEVATLRIVV
ncbi:MAG: hypothetical protein C4345_13590, partial [Chloroflexota bacterium]